MLLVMAAQVDFFSSCPPLPVCHLQLVSSQRMSKSGSDRNSTHSRTSEGQGCAAFLWCLSESVSLSDRFPHFVSLIVVTVQSESLPPIFGAQPVKFRVVHPGLQSQRFLLISCGNCSFFPSSQLRRRRGVWGPTGPPVFLAYSFSGLHSFSRTYTDKHVTWSDLDAHLCTVLGCLFDTSVWVQNPCYWT